jgi:hypothetical protein
MRSMLRCELHDKVDRNQSVQLAISTTAGHYRFEYLGCRTGDGGTIGNNRGNCAVVVICLRDRIIVAIAVLV